MKTRAIQNDKARIEDLENQLMEAQELIEAIKNGEVDAFAVNRNNTSEIYTLQSSDYAYRSLIENFGEGALTINEERLIVYTNSSFFNILGATYEEVIGSTICEWVDDDSKNDFEKLFEAGLVGSSKGEIVLKGPDNKKVPVYISLASLRPYLNKVGVIITDLTEKKQNEEAKNKAEEIARNAEAEAHSKQQFLSNMSHEIRTPLNAIIGFTTVMLRTELTEKQKKYLDAVKTSGDSLIVLINDILDLAKVNSGKMTFEQVPFKPETSVNNIMQLFFSKILSKKLIFKKYYDENLPSIVMGDPARLHQILVNLINNAIKFTDDGSISIYSKLIEQTDDNVLIEFLVKDTGIGIEKKNLKTIFENFQQATEETTRLYGGTGLGLAIVKQLVELQGGKLNVRSEVNNGSEFSFVMPFKKTTESIKQAEVLEPEKNTQAIKVLLVEDNLLNQLLMKAILGEFGFENDVADNGLMAIEKLSENDYDIILMDLQMPDMNGFEATDYIRKRMKSSIPIIALTADVTTVDKKKCRDLGINDYVPKPVDEKLLYAKMNKLVKRNN